MTRFSGISTLSSGIACFPESQAPRSISWQRSLQNGRNGALSQSRSRWHVGHLTRAGLIVRFEWRPSQGQQLSMNVTSFSAWVGRVVMPCQARKRTLQRWWLPLISG